MSRLLFVAVLFAAVTPAQSTEPKPFRIGEEHTVRSEVLGEDRRVLVYTPDSVGVGEQRFPVLYLLDGPNHFHHTTGVVEFLADCGRMPEMIVVAVANTKRTRDLTPHASDEMGGRAGGGADNFLAFLCDELAPWVESRYPTQPVRVLVGHSFGGLFCVHTLTKRPDFFRGIVAISPSMQWSDQRTVADFDAWLDAAEPITLPEGTKTSLYMTVGNEGGALLGGTMKLSGMLSARAPRDVRWKFRHMPTESHQSVPHRSTYDGLEWIFEGWSPTDPLALYDIGGLKAMEAQVDRVHQRLGFQATRETTMLMDVVWAMASSGRLIEAVDLLASLDADQLPPPMVFSYLANLAADKKDPAAQKAALQEGLRRYPNEDGLRRVASEQGLELPPKRLPSKGVDVPVETLQSYTGSYMVGPFRAAAVVRFADGRLHATIPGIEGEHALTAKSATEFKSSMGMTLTFDPGEDGKANSVTLAFGGREIPCKRVEK